MQFVQETYRQPCKAKPLEAESLRQVSRKGKTALIEAKAIAAQIAKLNQQIERGQANLLLAEVDDVAGCQNIRSRWRAQRDALQAEVDSSAVPAMMSKKETRSQVAQAMRELAELHERLTVADPEKSKTAFHSIFERITLFWHPPRRGQRSPPSRQNRHSTH